MNSNYIIIMAGGVGSRFWPMSTSSVPKQFIDILGTGKSMIQQTVDRFSGIAPIENIYVVTNVKYRELVLKQLPGISEDQVLLEPCMRNTAPCIAYASYKISKRDANANIVVASSDHLITDETGFKSIVLDGLNFIKDKDALLTVGIKPHRPEIGYGYIQAALSDDIFKKVEEFKEKPSFEKAEEYVADGNYYWNAGIFIWSVASIIDAFNRHLPEIADKFSEILPILGTSEEQEVIDKIYGDFQGVSIDYGIMEKSDNIYVIPSSFGWSDLGTWGAFWENKSHDVDGNSVRGRHTNLFECEDTIVNVPDDKIVILQGLNNYIVVEANGALVVCHKSQEQRIKEFRDIALRGVEDKKNSKIL